MADQADDDLSATSNMSPELAEAMGKARQRVEELKRGRKASDVIKYDKELRKVFSVRMNASELHRLRLVALQEDAGVTELARRLILEGVARLEAKQAESPAQPTAADLAEQLSAQLEVTKTIISVLREGKFSVPGEPPQAKE